MPPRTIILQSIASLAAPSCSRSIFATSSARVAPALRSFSTTRRDARTFSTRKSPYPLNTRSETLGKHTFHSSNVSRAPLKDPYEVLGVKKDATQAQIKKTYYQLAKKYHPDTAKDQTSKDRFVEIQAAYDILSDEKKRSAYDRYGSASQQPGFDADGFANGGPFGAGGFGGFQDFGGPFGAGGGRSQADIFETLFGSAFGGGGRARGGRAGFGEAPPTRGDDIGTNLNLSFLDACKGVNRTVNVTPVVDCSSCSGSGLKTGATRSVCSTCNGTGMRTYVIQSGFQMASTCTSCQGSGTTVPKGSQCGGCSGLGKVKVKKTVNVEVPAGVEDGMTIRVPGAGDMPVSGKGSPGDLLVRVNIAPSKAFRRQGTNLYHDARIPVHTALLGGKVRVPTLDGDVEVRVPGGTQNGEECVLKGRGLPPLYGGEKGDLYVAFGIQIPRALTKRQREILQQYADDVEGRATSRGPASNDSSPPPSASGTGTSASSTNNSETLDTKEGLRSEDMHQGQHRQKKAATG
ncbi:hypothetical protein BOTBODRAFT_26656 [Botryobasidium botryosum FD-172 SS1]|uniref:DnaJ homolog 1, mitochondrial n=1 Tax=Botryobasidium botryosum (strain FD-172 SS1) TaxID=930990 RepID=A0A067N117_BOTB1|nr:hypothetical protein BOTBODRAFT_26656 [Botryobasidium botryosum FD-172 SS1]